MKIAVVGATGLVGSVMLKVLAERGVAVSELIPVASVRSVGTQIEFNGKKYEVVTCDTALKKTPHVAIFSAGGETALEWAPRFAEIGTTVIDNSSAFRMHLDHQLIVPEINGHQLTAKDKIIANPNCSTIQLVMTLKPLHDLYNIKRVVISTYQSITGTGVKAVNQLAGERSGTPVEQAYPYPIDKNCLPHCDVFQDNGYTKEEMKLTNETKKILQDDNVKVTATAVRVPVVGGHSESVNIEFEKKPDLTAIRKTLNDTPGIVLQDNPAVNTYPMPIYAEGKDDVFVGRIRMDESQPNTINLWIVTDNLRKGAATNAVQILEHLIEQNLVKN